MEGFGNQMKVGIAIGIIAITVLGVMLLRPRPTPIRFIDAPASSGVTSARASTASSSVAAQVVVHVAGRVKQPGVYRFTADARVEDAVKAAGGAAQDADMDAINMAARLEDGKQLYVPSKQQTAAQAALVTPEYVPERLAPVRTSDGPSPAATGKSKLHDVGEGVVHINAASAEELQRLDGVGPATAQKILDYRKEHGGFKRIEELLDVSGIGPKKFEKMRPFVRL